MPELIITGDGSHSLRMDDQSETYHSRHGALTESDHVFIKNGLQFIMQKKRRIDLLEVGFGTGLNCLLTLIECKKNPDSSINYFALEPYPAQPDLIKQLNYTGLLDRSLGPAFMQMHQHISSPVMISEQLQLSRTTETLNNFETEHRFDLVYFDAFAPSVQPELWSEEVFRRLFSLMKEDSVLVTYCAKGSVKRAMKAAGFKIESLQGPPGKREMTRAIKV